MLLRSVVCSVGFTSLLVACGTGATGSQPSSASPSSPSASAPGSGAGLNTAQAQAVSNAASPNTAAAPSAPLSAEALQVHAVLSLLNTGLLTANATAGDLSASSVVTASNGCVSTVTQPATLNASKLPADWSVDWTFKNCRGFANSALDGTANVDVDTVCSTEQHVHASVDLTDSLGGANLHVQSSSDISVDDMAGCKDTTRVLDESGTRVTVTVDNNQVVGFKYTTELSVTDSRDPNTSKIEKLVFNGHGKFNQDGVKPDEVISVDHVTVVPAQCCYPVAGTLSVAAASDCPKDAPGSALQFSYTFGPTCGLVSVDGSHTVTLPACQ